MLERNGNTEHKLVIALTTRHIVVIVQRRSQLQEPGHTGAVWLPPQLSAH